jgi:hypothetical protein
MRFDTDSATPKLTFKPVKVLEAAEHHIVINQGKSDAALKSITMTVAEADGAKTAKLAAPAPAPAPAPKAEAAPAPKVEAEPVQEPVKRAAKKEEPAAPKSDLSQILSEWDDE